jgi:predicted nucleic acid-binding protein
MSIDRSSLLFFDASCLIAASGSRTGGSSFILALCHDGFLQSAISQWVLIEAERNIMAKLPPAAHARYQTLLHTTAFRLAPVPPPRSLQRYAHLVGDKDAHVLGAAVARGAAFLLSLDQPLIERIERADVAVRALTPKAFITEVLPTHHEYPRH